MDDLSNFCCQNPACPDHGTKGGGNLVVRGRYGVAKTYRLLMCRTCLARFSERKGTPLYRSHLPEEKVISILEHLTEGGGIRQTERLLKVHRDTVMRYGRLAGRHAKEAHDELVAFSPEDAGGPIR
jgi:transposase-like protein